MIDKRGSIRKARVVFALAGFFVLAVANLPRVLRAATKSLWTADDYFVYVGTYTGPKSQSQGIYGYRFDTKTGHFTPSGLAAEIRNPSFLATDPQHRFLYAATETEKDPKANGSVSSFSIDPKTGALKFLNKVSSGGQGPCHVAVDHTGKMLFVANFGSGSVASFAIRADGSLGDSTGFDQHHGSSVDPVRQTGPHAHEAVLSPDNRFLFTPDLGLDQVKIYRVNAAQGTFTPNDPSFAAVGAHLGPRHLAFDPRGKFVYVLCEIGSSVVAFSYDPAKGSMTPLQTISNLPSGFAGKDDGSAEIEVDRSGRFLYASNRGTDTDSITVFAIDPQKGTLTKVQMIPTQGKTPRNFAIDPTGKYLVAANQGSDRMVVFAIDQKTGQLTPAGQVLNTPSPVSILFVPAQ